MSQADVSYKSILEHIMCVGEFRETRTGNVVSAFSPPEFRFDMRFGFPLLTCKQVFLRQVIGEALWFLNGESKLSELRKRTFGEDDGQKWTIWSDDFARWGGEGNDEGGRIYGVQWRDYKDSLGHSADQIKSIVEKLKSTPKDRYMLVNAWNAAEIATNQMALPPCHVLFQAYVTNNGEMDLKWYQRSVDTFLGLPFNIASYGFILKVLCKICGLTPRYLIGSFGDSQIYTNHTKQVMQLMSNEVYTAPSFEIDFPINSLEDLKDFTAEDFLGCLKGYQHAGKIEAPLSVG